MDGGGVHHHYPLIPQLAQGGHNQQHSPIMATVNSWL